jgi:hypothetical protein
MVDGIPHLAYISDTGYEANVVKYEGSWQSIGAANFCAASSSNFLIDLGYYNNTMYVLFCDSGNNLTLMYYDNGWQFFSTNIAVNPQCFALGFDGTYLYIAYADYSASDQLIVKKYY